MSLDEELQGVDIDVAGADMPAWTKPSGSAGKVGCGYIQELDVDIFENCHMGFISPRSAISTPPLDYLTGDERIAGSGAIPIKKPSASFSNTHWDTHTGDERIAGSGTHTHTHSFSNLFPILLKLGSAACSRKPQWSAITRSRGPTFIPCGRYGQNWESGGLCEELRHAYDGTDDVYVHFDMDILGGAGPAPGDILGELAEPMGMTYYEIIRLAHEIGKRGLTGMSFICIPPGSMVTYRLIVYIIAFLIAGVALSRGNPGPVKMRSRIGFASRGNL